MVSSFDAKPIILAKINSWLSHHFPCRYTLLIFQFLSLILTLTSFRIIQNIIFLSKVHKMSHNSLQIFLWFSGKITSVAERTSCSTDLVEVTTNFSCHLLARLWILNCHSDPTRVKSSVGSSPFSGSNFAILRCSLLSRTWI